MKTLRRRVIDQSSKEMSEQAKDTDPEKARLDRCRRRAERAGGGCRCGEKRRSRSRSRRRRGRRILSQNPFIIFYLEMYFKTPGKRVTEVARQAGKEWCSMPEEERLKYVRLAEKERNRRGGRRGRRGTRRRRRRI